MDAEDIKRKESALSALLSQMDVPKNRKDVTSTSNLRWLLRNLRINNRDHPMLDTTVALTKSIHTGKRKLAEREVQT